MAIEMNGIAHIQLTVKDAGRCIPFWEQLCHFLGMKTLIKDDEIVYCIGSRTGILVRGAPPEKRGVRFDQDTAGLHHLCLRARKREDVDAIHTFARDTLGATIVREPTESSWAPGYYSILFEDPDGIRVEVNHVPGRGHLGNGGRLGEGGAGPATEIGEGGLDQP